MTIKNDILGVYTIPCSFESIIQPSFQVKQYENKDIWNMPIIMVFNR